MRPIFLPKCKKVESQVRSSSSPTALVSVREAKKLAISIHGSMEFLWDRLDAHKARHIRNAKEIKQIRSYQARKLLIEASLWPSHPNDVTHWAYYPHWLANLYDSIAAMEFPVMLPDKTLENGIWCRGCYSRAQDKGTPPSVTLKRGFYAFIHHCIDLSSMQQRAWTKEEFLCHLSNVMGPTNSFLN
ncbi:hypothetical protein PHISCL_00924 [Aspergillus sclerotialis]|uniref:Uncharacterized protein n=1 Tax=Aspergillus sclerotialis TaxID=2070753 RepID=A0A3A2ZWI0_9EURO|nr:hypothetical protein PHISCL_00924 [Aspergillus sclerotialis]